jgi:hypothetical protein
VVWIKVPDIARDHWWLCCCESKARATIARAKDLGLLRVDEGRDGAGRQAHNGYSVDMAGVRAILKPPAPAVEAEPDQPIEGSTTKRPPSTTKSPPSTTWPPPSTASRPQQVARHEDEGQSTHDPPPTAGPDPHLPAPSPSREPEGSLDARRVPSPLGQDECASSTYQESKSKINQGTGGARSAAAVADSYRRNARSAIEEAARDATMQVGAIAAAVMARASHDLKAGATPAAEYEEWRSLVQSSVPQAEPNWWVADRLGALVAFGFDGQPLAKDFLRGLLRRLAERLQKGRSGQLEPIDDPPGYFQRMCNREITYDRCKIDWSEVAKRYHKRE